MSQSISIRGSIITGSSLCSSSSSAGQCSKQLALSGGCAEEGVSYGDLVSGSVTIATSGSVGDAFERLDLLSDLAQIEFLYLKSSDRVRVRLGATPSTWTGNALGTVNFVGGEFFEWEPDGLLVTVNFVAESLTAAQIAARINAAAALAGMATPRATVDAGRLVLTTENIGPTATQTGSGDLALLGLDGFAIVNGEGTLLDVAGLALVQFPRSPNAPARVDVSGNATLEVIAAGRPA